ncbi:hypothetical protein GOODEAATRI_030929, partial [Goodea atripinnis]
GYRGAVAYLQQSTGERRDTPWAGHQSIQGQHTGQPCTHPFTPKGNLEKPINLTVMFLDCGRREPMYAQGNIKLHVERPKTPRKNLGPSCCKATVLTTVPPCRNLRNNSLQFYVTYQQC